MKFPIPMPPLDENTVYAADAFAGMIGKTVPLTAPGGYSQPAIVRAVQVDADGRGATLTVEVDQPPPELQRAALGHSSLRSKAQ